MQFVFNMLLIGSMYAVIRVYFTSDLVNQAFVFSDTEWQLHGIAIRFLGGTIQLLYYCTF